MIYLKIALLVLYACMLFVPWVLHVRHCRSKGHAIGFSRAQRHRSGLTDQQREVISTAMQAGYTPAATSHKSHRAAQGGL